MRSLALFLLFAGTTGLAFELKRVNVAQLEQDSKRPAGVCRMRKRRGSSRTCN